MSRTWFPEQLHKRRHSIVAFGRLLVGVVGQQELHGNDDHIGQHEVEVGDLVPAQFANDDYGLEAVRVTYDLVMPLLREVTRCNHERGT